MDAEGSGSDQTIAPQLIDKTTSLTISGVDDEVDAAGNTPALLASEQADASDPPPFADARSCSEPGAKEQAGDASTTSAGVSLDQQYPYCRARRDACPIVGSEETESASTSSIVPQRGRPRQLLDLPNEVLLHILSFLEVCDLLATSRTSHHLRSLSLLPHLHTLRLRRARASLPPLLFSPSRPSLEDLSARNIRLTPTAFTSRVLARNLARIRLARQLARRPPVEVLVQRCVLPVECVPARYCGSSSSSSNGGGGDGGAGVRGVVSVAPGLVARKRAVERERVKDGLRQWVGSVWKGEVRRRAEGVRRREEMLGIGRVWRMRMFWEGMARRADEG
ncbi:hypothetical protein VTK26DRAFT_1125 [Humicola hyalothermophila]